MHIYNTLECLQRSIISGDAQLAASLVRVKPHMSAEQQIGIYMDAYRVRLGHAVISDHPCLAHCYGEALQKIVVDYVAAVPSNSYNLDFYPFAFWSFAQKLLPTDMAELAELEGVIAQCFMSHGTSPLQPEDLPHDAEELGHMHLQLRKPYRLLSFSYDVDAVIHHYKNGVKYPTAIKKPIYLLVYRPNREVVCRRLEDAEYLLLNAIEGAACFDDAIRQVLNATGISDEIMATHVMRWLPLWILEGCLAVKA